MKKEHLRNFRLFLTFGMAAALFGCGPEMGGAAHPLPPRYGDLQWYRSDIAFNKTILPKRIGNVTGSVRIAHEVVLLSERHDAGTVALVRAMVALMEKHHLPVDADLANLTSSYEEATAEDAAWARELSLGLYDGITPGSAPADEPLVEGEMLSAEFMDDLRSLLIAKCPDRAVRLTVMLSDSRAKDVKWRTELQEGKVAAKDFTATFEKRKAEFAEVFGSMTDRPGDPMNVSVLEVFEQMQGNGLANVMHCFAQANVPSNGHEVREMGVKMVEAANAARELDPAKSTQIMLDRFITGMLKGRPWLEDLDASVVEWNQQMPVVWEFIGALRSNSHEAMAGSCGAQLSAELAQERDLARAVLRDPGAHDVRVVTPGLPLRNRRQDEFVGLDVAVTYRNGDGALKSTNVHLTMKVDGGKWTIEGIGGAAGQ